MLLALAGTAFGQRQARVGLGFNALLTTAEGLGLGVRTRAAAPVSADLSLAVDLASRVSSSGAATRPVTYSTHSFRPS
ncbi:hypothetical protein [Rhodothermus marinus]|uniref:hypothetical protein n=1 Tax=Rhodothermus marinus TaxID=29549 RepID=UPI001FB37499|nr:hypothetical protein [Rhodothermus marinus]